MPQTIPTIVDQRTGTPVPVYIGADLPADPDPNAQGTPVDRGDNVTPSPASTPAPEPAATNPAAAPTDEPGGEGVDEGTPDQGAQPDDGSVPSDPVTPAEPPRDGKYIPRSRFNEVLEDRRNLKEENERLKAQLAAFTNEQPKQEEPQYDFAAKEKEYIELVLDGKTDEAIALRDEIRAEEKKLYQRLAQEQAASATQRLTVEQRINQVSAQYESTYAQLNPESEEYSEELLNDVQALLAGYRQTGRYNDPVVALEAAIQSALRLHNIPLKDAGGSTLVPAQRSVAAPPPTQRTAQRRVDAIVQQPPLLAKTGAQSGDHGTNAIDVRSLTPEQLMQLPEATRRRLRGDEL